MTKTRVRRPHVMRKAVKATTPTKSERRRLDSFGAPWLMAALALVTGAGLHLRVEEAGGPARVMVPLLVAGGGAFLGWLTYQYAHARKPLQRWHASSTAVLAGVALALVSLTGLGASPWRELYIGGAVLVALSWNVRRFDAVRGDGSDGHGQEVDGGWGHVLGLPGSVVRAVRQEGPRIEVDGQTVNGQSAKDAQAKTDAIAAAASVPPGGVRITPNPDHADRFRMVIVAEDVLRHDIPWPGPQAGGKSIADAPVSLGKYETDVPLQRWLPGKGSRNLAHVLRMGMTGSGKTESALVEATDIMTRTDVVVWWADTVKGAQTVWPIRSGIDWFAGTKREAGRMLAAVRAVIPARTAYLGAKRMDQWRKGCGLSFLYVHVEEAADLLGDSETFVRLTEQARSAGILLSISLQRASHDNLPTSARANLGASMCFGVESDTDAGFALSESTQDAGARPELWKGDRPGYVYLEAPGVSRDLWSTPARGYRAKGEELLAVVRAHANVRTQLDATTAGAAGSAYADRDRGGATLSAQEVPVSQPDDPDALSTVDDDDDPEGQYVIPEQPEPELAELDDPRAELAHDPEAEAVDLTPPPPAVPSSREGRVAAFRSMIDELTAKGAVEVRMLDLVERYASVAPPGNQRPFLHDQLRTLIETGRVERLESGRGRYLLHPASELAGAVAGAHGE